MKIAIISGSPRGKNSSTRRHTEYIKKTYPEHDYSELSVGRKIIRLEKNDDLLNSYFDEIAKSDAIIWSFPVYVFIAPSQVVRFVELIHKRGRQDVFEGKYTTLITTSFNFFDHTAHNYMRGICEDLGMHFFEGFSPSMFALKDAEMKRNLQGFAEEFFHRAEHTSYLDKASTPISNRTVDYRPENIEDRPKSGEKKLLVLTDAGESDHNLNRMIDVFTRSVSIPVEVANLNQIDIRGGCMGCIKCMSTAECAYNDEFCDFFRETVSRPDGIIYAGTIGERYFSAKWKQFYDRCFFNGHRPVFAGKVSGYLVAGPLRQLPNLRQIMDAHAQIGRTLSAGLVTDECDDDRELTSRIRSFAEAVERRMTGRWNRPTTFLGEGGHKIFRDLVYENRLLMVEDHKYYKEHGLYDFPNIDA